MNHPGVNRGLHEAELRVMSRCAEEPCARLQFSGIDRMALQLLAARGWLEPVSTDGRETFRPTPSGLVALSLAQLTAAE